MKRPGVGVFAFLDRHAEKRPPNRAAAVFRRDIELHQHLTRLDAEGVVEDVGKKAGDVARRHARGCAGGCL